MDYKTDFLNKYVKNKQHRQFYVWDVETFNDMLEKTKIPLNCETFKNSRSEIMSAIGRFEDYLTILYKYDRMYKLKEQKKDKSLTEDEIKEIDAEINYIDGNIYNDFANYMAAYPSYDTFYYRQNEEGETIDAWYKHLKKEYQDWIEEYEGITETNLVEDEKK